MTEHDALIARLRGLGDQPVDPVVASEHLTAMAAVGRAPVAARSRFGRAKVAAAFAAGLVLGGTSLASAGVMGEGVQNAVADAAAKVNVNLPGGTARSTDGCGGITARNHGDFVRQGGDPKANCGKPQKAVDNRANAGVDADDDAGEAGCKPPWAGKGTAGKALRTPEAVAAHEACTGDDTESGTTGQPETTGTVGSQGEGPPAGVTPPSAPEDNAGLGSDIPADQGQGGDVRPEAPGEPASPPSTVPDQADDNRRSGDDVSGGATTATVGQP